MVVLLGFGVVHLLLIWSGDILTEYAFAGFMALPFVLAPAKVTLTGAAGASLLSISLPCLPVAAPFPGPG